MTSSKSYYLSIAFFVGLVLLYVGERLIGVGTGRTVASLTGLLLVAVAVALRAGRVASASGAPDRASVERSLLALYAVGLLGVLLYGAQSDLMNRLLDKPFEQAWPKLSVVLAALWPICVFASVIPVFFAELAYAGMVRAPKVESNRVKEALYSGLGVTFALVLAMTVVYVATVRDEKKDFSYFRTARAGSATKKVVAALDAPVEVALFFPPANEVKEQVMEYLSDLQKESPKLQVQQYDQAVDPSKARDLSVVSNGAIVLSRGNKREQMNIGVDFERARSQLRTFDQDFQKRLRQVSRERRVVYFTTGHGERNEERSGTGSRPGVSGLKSILGNLNLDVRNLGAAEGLATDVPQDANAVMLIGPTKALLPEEASALVRYVKRGGHLLAAIDPQSAADYEPLLAQLGLRMLPATLANDQTYVKRSSQLSDRTAIIAANFTSHPSVTTLSQFSGRAAVVLLEAGALEVIQPKPEAIQLEATVRSLPTTFNDLNNNFTFDAPAESRKSWDLVVAINAKPAGKDATEEGRALIVADSDALSDLILGNPANEAFVMDGVKWLSGDEGTAGAVTNESDVPIQHTKKEDVVWFYATIFVAPALVLAVGFLVTRRRRPRARVRVGSPAISGGAQ